MNRACSQIGLPRTACVLTLLCTMAIGCRHTRETACDASCDTTPSAAQASNERLRSSPAMIVPVPAEAGDDAILLTFCDELATALHQAGATHVTVETVPHPLCEMTFDGAVPLPSTSTEEPATGTIFVTVRDFRPYRPMRMAIDVRVVDSAGDEELLRIGEVFHGPDDSADRAVRKRVRLPNRLRRRNAGASTEMFRANSPQWFLADVAQSVADRLMADAPSRGNDLRHASPRSIRLFR